MSYTCLSSLSVIRSHKYKKEHISLLYAINLSSNPDWSVLSNQALALSKLSWSALIGLHQLTRSADWFCEYSLKSGYSIDNPVNSCYSGHDESK